MKSTRRWLLLLAALAALALAPNLRAGGPIVPPYPQYVSPENAGPKNQAHQPQGLWGIGGAHFKGSVISECLQEPSAPVTHIHGTAGTASATYYCVDMDQNHRQTIPSAATVINNAPNTLSATNNVRVVCPGQGGMLGAIVLKGTTSFEIGSCVGGANASMVENPAGGRGVGQGCMVVDAGQPAAAYTPKQDNSETCGFATIAPPTPTPTARVTETPLPPTPTATPTGVGMLLQDYRADRLS